MRTRLGWALSVLGVLVALLGLVVMVLLGPDSRFSTGPHPVETDGIAIVTAPKVISWADVQVDLLAEVPVRKPIFVGIANSVDVENFVGKTQRLEVTGFHTPWKVKTREIKGRANLPGAPTAVDWWIADSAGLGGASISTELPDETVSAVILSVGSTNLSGVEVTLAYGIKGGFYKGIALLLLGVAGVWAGRMIRRDAVVWYAEAYEEGPIIEEEVVYVYVDEDGVEHEMSVEEAEAYDIVEESVEVVEVEPEPVPEPEPEVEPAPESEVEPAPEPVVPRIPGVMTAAEIAAAAEVAPEPEPTPPPKPAETSERIMYVFVDEDGVEHEVHEDELGDFDIVDDEEET
jgi:hypothetical protein